MYCMYLRKSRADLKAEALGEKETLSKHEHLLLSTATNLNLSINTIYREIQSGESIQNRPVMKKLLSEVENGLWRGVFVVEIERLARGDSIDQGLVLKTFKYSHTLIITPLKTYDPNDEFDEEYFEFGLFMSRREYKTINRRMRRGIIQSAKDGYWPYNRAPYGYSISPLPNNMGFSLAINKSESVIYQELMQQAAYGRLGDTKNAHYLNMRGLPTRSGKPWSASSVYSIRTNPVHTGKVIYGRRRQIKSIKNGETLYSRPRNLSPEIYAGKHIPLIDMETWLEAQKPFR